jgi:hypothetical protein
MAASKGGWRDGGHLPSVFTGCHAVRHPAKSFLFFFKKILCRVPPELAPGKGFFAGGQVWHPANYNFFFVFGPIFFCGLGTVIITPCQHLRHF